jgi:hypothetical protein
MKRFLPSLRRLFGLGPKLRNKAGGMAWIKHYGADYGADAIAGLAVKTVRLTDGRFWVVDPAPRYTVGPNGVRGPDGVTAYPGERVIAIAIADECLEPWKDIGDDAQDESARYLPPVPQVAAPMVTKEAA